MLSNSLAERRRCKASSCLVLSCLFVVACAQRVGSMRCDGPSLLPRSRSLAAPPKASKLIVVVSDAQASCWDHTTNFMEGSGWRRKQDKMGKKAMGWKRNYPVVLLGVLSCLIALCLIVSLEGKGCPWLLCVFVGRYVCWLVGGVGLLIAAVAL